CGSFSKNATSRSGKAWIPDGTLKSMIKRRKDLYRTWKMTIDTVLKPLLWTSYEQLKTKIKAYVKQKRNECFNDFQRSFDKFDNAEKLKWIRNVKRKQVKQQSLLYEDKLDDYTKYFAGLYQRNH